MTRAELLTIITTNGGHITARQLVRKKYRLPTQRAVYFLQELVDANLGEWRTIYQTRGGRPSRRFCLFESTPYISNPIRMPKIGAQPDVPEVRELRKLEARNIRLSDELKLEKKKRKQADADLAEARKSVEAATEAIKKHSPPVIKVNRKPSGRGSATFCTLVTDWHLEATVIPDRINGLNTFNLQIAEARLQRLWEKALYMLDFTSHISNITEMLLWAGGDMVNNDIHPSMAETNQLGPSDAVLLVQDNLAAGIDLFLRETSLPLVFCSSNGNHPRTTTKKRIDTAAQHSLEYIAFKNLERIYRNEPRVRFQVAEGYLNYVETQGKILRFHHGDACRYNGGVGGFGIPLRKRIAQWDKQRRADLSINGHFHSYESTWNYLSVGCLCGFNAYALELGFDYQPATQAVMVIDKDYGQVLAAPIFLDRRVSNG